MKNIYRLLYLSRAQVTPVTNAPLGEGYDRAGGASVTAVTGCHRKSASMQGGTIEQGETTEDYRSEGRTAASPTGNTAPAEEVKSKRP
jgi:hypothetical protein